jgi:hypothetical protein
VLAAVAGVLALPAAVAISRESPRVHLLDTGWALPVAGLLGVLAIVLGTRARREAEWAVTRAAGLRLARAGRALGVLAVCIAVAGGIAIAYFELLRRLH